MSDLTHDPNCSAYRPRPTQSTTRHVYPYPDVSVLDPPTTQTIVVSPPPVNVQINERNMVSDVAVGYLAGRGAAWLIGKIFLGL